MMTTKNSSPGAVVSDIDPRAVFNNNGVVQTVDKKDIRIKDINDLSEAEAIFDSRITLKQLSMPEALTITVKRKEFAYRWINYKGHGGQNYSKFKLWGWQNATTDDVTPQNDKAVTPDGIIWGDLLLMKLPREIYFAHLKENYVRANIHRSRVMTDEDKFERSYKLEQEVAGPDVSADLLRTFKPAMSQVEKSSLKTSPPQK